MLTSPRICKACQTALAQEHASIDLFSETTCPNCGAVIPPASHTFELPQKPGLHDTALSLSPESSDLELELGPNLRTIIGPHGPPSSPDFPFLGPPQQDDELGRLGPYRVLDVLGMGGMGIVFRGEDPQLKRQIALKAMLPAYATSAADVARFLREDRAQAAVEHDHVASIHQVGEDRGVPFIAMPLLKGQTLAGALRTSSRLALAEAVRIAREMAEGLAAAHECGLIHRDIKPANVWLEGKNRRVKILDFGLARMNGASTQIAGDSTPMTQQGVVVGTPAYMSPEQAKGDPLDLRSDLFSLGIVLYQMLVGHEPFRSGTMTGLLIAVATEHPPRPADLNPAVPHDLDAFTMRLLAKNRDHRPATGEETAQHLRLIEAGLANPEMGVIPLAMPVDDSGRKVPPDSWGKVGSSATQVVVPLTADDEPSVPMLQRVAVPEAPRKRPWLFVAVLLAFVGFTAAAADIIIKIKNKDGTETEIKLPEGTKIAVNGNDVTPPAKKLPPTGTDADVTAATWVLSIGGRVGVNDQETFIKDAKQLPPKPFRLTAVEIKSNAQLTDADLARLNDCMSLASLELDSCVNITGTGWAHRQDWTYLRHLHLGHTGFQNEGLAAFSECQQLTFLDLGHTQIGDAGLANFKGCKNLQTLRLGNTSTSDYGLLNFKDCKDITELSLDSTMTGDAGFAYFKDCRAMKNVDVSRSRISDASVPLLQSLTNLTHLTIGMTLITPKGITDLRSAFPQGIHLSGDGKPEPFNHRVAAEAALRLGGRVSINGQAGKLTAPGALPNQSFQITGLDLSGLKNLTDDHLRAFRSCPTLKMLVLTQTPTHDTGLVNFVGCTQLDFVNLDNTQITDLGVAYVSGCQSLKNLFLNQTRITNAGVATLADCKNLKELWLDDTKVTDFGLRTFRDCFSLRTLNLRADGITSKGAQELANSLPRCEIEWRTGKRTRVDDPDRATALWVLSRGGQVSVNGSGDLVRNSNQLPKPQFKLTHAEMRENKELKDQWLVNFADCTNLKSLWLSDTQVTDAGLANLKDLSNLETLVLGGCKRVTDKGLANFKGCNKLKKLWLNDTQVTDVGFAIFKDCVAMEYLELINTQVGDAGVAHCSKFKNLNNLRLRGSRLTDAGLVSLRDCKALQILEVNQTKVTAAGLAEFMKAVPQCKIEWDQQLPKAKTRDDRGAAEAIIRFGGSVQINSIRKDITAIGGLPKTDFVLTQIDFKKQTATDGELALLQGCSDLADVRLDSTSVTDEGIARLIGFPKLSTLSLADTKVTDASVRRFKEFKSLAILILNGLPITDASLDHLKGCPRLSVVSLMNTPVGNDGLTHVKECKKLIHLNLDGTKVTDAGLGHLKDLKELKELYLQQTQVSATGIEELERALPQCVVYWAGNPKKK